MIDVLLSDGPHEVLDVGCGTGISARLFTARGCDVLGLEPDARMAAVARSRGVKVEDGNFEEWEAAGRRFGLLTVGQAWHWVHPQVGAAKAVQVLRPGGRIGCFWNQAQPAPTIRPALDSVYGRLAPELGEHSVLVGRRSPMLYEGVADAMRSTGGFAEVTLELFEHEVVYPTDRWLELAETHSDHRTLPPDVLGRLLGALGEAIDGAGGRVPVRYETTLVTGRTISAR
jgi:SAM-dependent methyltransferase